MNRFFRRRNFVILTLACLTAVLVNPLPAHADVDTVSSGGFAARANLLGAVLLAPTPGGLPNGVNFAATEPVDGYNQNIDGINIALPQVLTANVLNVNSVAQGLAGENHAGSVTTTSSVANVVVGPSVPPATPALTVDAISSTCTSNGDGSTGSTSVVNLRAPGGGPPITDTFSGGPVDISIPGVASIILNEQAESNVVGATSIVVNAVHITLLGTAVEIILGQSRCAAAGPDVNVATGSVQVTKDAPADAQGVVFTFTISCLDAGGAHVAGSPFTRSVTGDGTTLPVTGLTPGTVCTASEVPVSGFVVQPNQTFAPVASGVTRTLTFVNTRTAQTGSVAVTKQAPDDAQAVVFTFTISCPGQADVTRTVTGSGTSTAVTGIPVGTTCTAAETPVAGFVDQPDLTFPAVEADITQTVTFFNQRTGANTGAVAVIKQAPADAQNVTFTFTITCPGVAGSPFTRTATGSQATTAVGNLPVGTVCTVAETPVSGFDVQPSQTFPAVTAGTTQTRTFVNTRTGTGASTIQVDKSASPVSRPQPGGSFTFTVSVTNNGSQSVVITSIVDDVHGNLNGRGSCATGATLTASPGPGNVYTCSFSVDFTGNTGASQTDKVTVTAVDPAGTSVTDTSDGVTISITAPGTPIVLPPPGSVTTNIFLVQQPQRAADGAIIVNNNNSSSSSSSAAAAAGGGTAAAAPPGSPVTPPQTLVRTGMDSLALGALALFLLMAGFVMLSATPAYAGGYRAPRSRRRRRRRR